MRDRERGRAEVGFDPEDDSIPPRLWTTLDVAEYLRISERSVRTLMRTKRLPSLRIGGAVRFEPAGIASWAKRQRRED